MNQRNVSACALDFCDRDSQSRGLCKPHYLQTWRGQELRPLRPQRSQEGRFWVKVAPEPDEAGCLNWIGAKHGRGYGAFWADGRLQQAHRVLYEWTHGKISAGLDLDHLCRNIACVNPDHLEPVTRSENNRRGMRGYGARDRCTSGRHRIDGPDTYYTWASGDRTCKECAKEQARAQHARKREKATRVNSFAA